MAGAVKGRNHHKTDLRESDVVEIRRRVATGESQEKVRKDFGLSPAGISNIVKGKTWKHITERSGNSVIYKEEYGIWKMVIQRCTNPKHISYKDYGGRGITIFSGWLNDFEAFLSEVGARPSKGHSLDRVDPNKGYEPGNLRWATGKEQARNKRNSVYLPHPITGELVPAANLAEELNISYREFRQQMIKQGKWPNTAPKGKEG